MAESKPLNWWIKSTQNVHSVLKPHVERHNELNGKKILGTLHVTIAKRLKTSGLLSSITTPSNDVILSEFNKYVAELEVTKPEPEPETVPEVIEAPKPSEDELVSLLHKLLKDSDKELIIRRRRTCCLW